MSLKENKFIQKYLENEKSIFEGIVVSLVTALAFTAILTGSFKNVTNIDFVKNTSLLKVILIFVFGGILAGILYHSKKVWAKLTMFGAVMIYFLMAGYSSSNIDFTSSTKNPIGQVCFLAFSGILAVIAFLYVKDDVLKFQEKIKVSNKLLKIYTLVIGVLILALSAVIGVYKYKAYAAPTFDFGIFAQGFEYMKQTGEFKTVLERGHELSHFAVHFSPIFYLALPIYFIVPKPETVAVIQAIMVALPVIPIYLLGKQYKLSNKMVAAIIAIYALFPATIGGIFYDIHENCFLPALLLWLFLCYEKRRFALMSIPAVLILSVKEDAAVYLVFFGLYLLLARRDWKRSLPLMAVAIAYFTLAVYLLQTYGQGAMFGRYDNVFGGNLMTGGLFGTLLRDPAYFLTQIADGANFAKKMQYLLQMLLPLGLLFWTPRGKFSRLLLMMPLLMNLLTQYPYQFDVTFQYSFGTMPFLFYLLVQNAADAEPRFRREQLSFALVAAWLMYLFMVWPSFVHQVRTMHENHETYATMERVLDAVPDNVSVTASTMLLPHLADRPVIYEDFYHRNEYGKVIPDTEYAVLDIRPHWLTQSSGYRETYLEAGYTVVYEEPNLILILKAP